MKLALYNLTTTTRWGGVENFVWEVAAQMAARGHKVDLFGGRGTITGRTVKGVRVRRYPYIDRDLWRKIPLLGRQYTLTKMLERLSMVPFVLPRLLLGRYDIIHIQKPYDLPVGALAKLSRAKLLFGCHGKDFWPGDRAFVRFANGSVAASKFNAEQVKERYRIDPVVVYNGVDLDLFKAYAAGDEPSAALERWDDEVLAEYGLSVSAEQPALLYAARLVRWKGGEYLIQALPMLKPEGTQLWVAGEGPYEEELRTLAARLGVTDRIKWLGRVEQPKLAALYRKCTMLVAGSFVNETFGMALCEAMACGAVVVASDFGGFREVVVDGETGFLARSQDPDDFARKINILLADPALAARMGEAGRQRVHSHFSWEAVGDRLEEVYRCIAPSST